MKAFLELAQNLQMALKGLQLYSASHPRTQETLEKALTALNAWLGDRGSLQLVVSNQKAFLDGVPVEEKSLHLDALIRQIGERQINGFVFERGLGVDELAGFMEILCTKPQRVQEGGGVAQLLEAKGVTHIRVSQTRYKEIGEADAAGGPEAPAFVEPAQGTGTATPPPVPTEAPEAAAAAAPQGWLDLLRKALSGALGPSAGEGALPVDVPRAELGGLEAPAGGGPDEALRTGMLALPPLGLLSLFRGFASLSPDLRPAFEPLAPELLAHATAALFAQGLGAGEIGRLLAPVLGSLPDRAGTTRALLSHLPAEGLGVGDLEALGQHLSWEALGLELKIARALEGNQLFRLKLEQSLGLLREALSMGRVESFQSLVEKAAEALQSEDPALRLPAAQILAGIAPWTREPGFPADTEVAMLDALLPHFTWEPVPPIHRQGYEALGILVCGQLEHGELERVRRFMEELRDLCSFTQEDTPWRMEAMDELQDRLGLPQHMAGAIRALMEVDKEAAAGEVYPFLQFMGTAAADVLVETLASEEDRSRRGRLLEAIKALGQGAVPPLLVALRAQEWYVVRNALNLVGELGELSAREDVLPCLQHRDVRVKRAAVRAVWKLGGPKAESPLLAQLAGSDPGTQQEILFCLGQMKAAAAMAAVMELARATEDEKTRLKALETLGLLGAPGAIPYLAELLKKKGFLAGFEPLETRIAAARALRAIGTAEALDLLQKAIEASRAEDQRHLQQA